MFSTGELMDNGGRTSSRNNSQNIFTMGAVGGLSGSVEIGDQEEQVNKWKVAQPLPCPKPFDGKGPKKFRSFKTQYEAYASSMWLNNKEGWKLGLEKLLKGYPLALYLSYMEQGNSYDTIILKLEGAFKGENDPFKVHKLLKLKTMKRGVNESWGIFHKRIENILTEMYPSISEEDRAVRVREIFMQKIDNKTAEKIVNLCLIKNDFSPDRVYEAALSLDSIPREMVSLDETGSSESEDEVNMVKYDTIGGKFKEDKHCLYCGKRDHYMADCPAYKNQCQRCTCLELGTREEIKPVEVGSNMHRGGVRGGYSLGNQENSNQGNFNNGNFNQDNSDRGNFNQGNFKW